MESTASRLAATLSQIISTNCSRQPPVIIVACASEAASLPGPLRRCFTHELSAEAPDAAGRQMLLQVGHAHGYTLEAQAGYVALTPASLLMLLGWPQICIWTGSGTAYSLHLGPARQT